MVNRKAWPRCRLSGVLFLLTLGGLLEGSLFHLTPSIQEEILHLPMVTEGKDPIHERMLRPIAAEVDWGRQREMWEKMANDARSP
jgi:hypothetical protein